MALIKCPDCGRDISDRISSCIHCGCPMDCSNTTKNKQNENHKIITSSQHIVPSLEVKKIKLDTDCFYYSSKKYNYENIVSLYYKYESVTINFVNSKSAEIKLKLDDDSVLKISAAGAFQKNNIKKISDAYSILREVTFPRRFEYYMDQFHKKGFIEYKYWLKINELGVWSAVLKTPTSVRIFPEGYIEKGSKRYDLKIAKEKGILAFGGNWEFGCNNSCDPTQIVISEAQGKYLLQFRLLRINAVWDTDVIQGIIKALSEGHSF